MGVIRFLCKSYLLFLCLDRARTNRGINFSIESLCSLSLYLEPEEQELIAILSMPLKNQKPVTMKIALKVTRVDDQAEQTAFQFENLSSENFTILEKYLTHRSTLPLK